MTRAVREGFRARKVVQIAAPANSDKTTTSFIALCDDGSLWEFTRLTNHHEMWVRLTSIPQDDQ